MKYNESKALVFKFSMFYPGDRVGQAIEAKLANVTVKGKPVSSVRLGPGLRHILSADGHTEHILASTAGQLQFRAPNKFWLESHGRRNRYIPHLGDLVIGRVAVKTADYLKVDLGAAHLAVLPLQSGFEATTRRSRPTLALGSLLYGRVSQADPFIEPEMLCVDVNGRAGSFGELPPVRDSDKSGFMLFRCPINRSWQLQRPDCPILELLGRHLPFEIVIGANGQYAIDSPHPALTLLIHHWIQGDLMDEAKIRAAAKRFSSPGNTK